ncbi:MAG: glycerate kinase [Oscillospiraceae bacterium]|nr:glycerate kinase [Oscillospiraceae bacterium]
MKKFVIAPDSFKGTASASDICEIGKRAILRIIPDAEISSLPIADGGEGTADCFLFALGGKKIECEVSGPHFTKVTASYVIINDDCAIVEIASAAGLPMVGKGNNPAKSTTFGVGELISDALSRGVRKIVLALGGSCTNDGACGIAAALGARFIDSDGEEFVPVGGSLGRIEKIDISTLQKKLDGVEVVAMCDIDNPLYGERGAACIFAPQKGADEACVRLLDNNLIAFANAVRRELGADIATLPGAGAAGGAGAGAVAFLGAKLCSGIETVLDLCGFETLAKDADLIITGEGRIDGQTTGGKAISGIASRAKALGVPVAVIAGDIGDNIDPMYDMGVSFILSTNRVAKSFSETKHRAKSDLELTFETLARMIKTVEITNAK